MSFIDMGMRMMICSINTRLPKPASTEQSDDTFAFLMSTFLACREPSKFLVRLPIWGILDQYCRYTHVSDSQTWEMQRPLCIASVYGRISLLQSADRGLHNKKRRQDDSCRPPAYLTAASLPERLTILSASRLQWHYLPFPSPPARQLGLSARHSPSTFPRIGRASEVGAGSFLVAVNDES